MKTLIKIVYSAPQSTDTTIREAMEAFERILTAFNITFKSKVINPDKLYAIYETNLIDRTGFNLFWDALGDECTNDPDTIIPEKFQYYYPGDNKESYKEWLLTTTISCRKTGWVATEFNMIYL